MPEFTAPGRRINVRGTTGSGKSTLGKALGQKLGIPYVELDSINHLPNWQEIEKDEFRRIVSEIVTRPEGWVIDGNYVKVRDLIVEKADTFVWLDYPLPILMYRLYTRTFRRYATNEVLWNGNRERFWNHFFTKDSIFLWQFQTYKRRRKQADEFFADPAFADRIRIRFRHPRETQAWLEQVK